MIKLVMVHTVTAEQDQHILNNIKHVLKIMTALAIFLLAQKLFASNALKDKYSTQL